MHSGAPQHARDMDVDGDRWVGCSSWWGRRRQVRDEAARIMSPKSTSTSKSMSPSPSPSPPSPRIWSVTESLGLSSPPPEPQSTLRSAWETAEHYAFQTPAGTAVTSAALTTTTLLVYWRYFRRLKNADYITPRELRLRRTITGKVTSIGDADGFRLYHQPGPPLLRSLLHPAPTTPRELKDQTLSIRLAGADAPELAHFGKTEQPFAKEARAELSRLIEGRTVRCEVAHIDQYKRLVATPYVWQPPYVFGRTNVSLVLVRSGLATVYRQSGAAYGSANFLWRFFFNAKTGLNRLERAERVAKRRKIGIWSLGKKLERPDEYKRRVKGEQ